MDNEKRLYNIWSCMKQRCNNPKHTAAAWYHDRGIRVCDEWEHDFEAFKAWSLKNGYAPTLSIDRVDPDGDYRPDNCRWIPLDENRKLARRPVTWRKKETRAYEVWYVAGYSGWAFVEKTGLTRKEAKQYCKEWDEEDLKRRTKEGWKPYIAGMRVIRPKEKRKPGDFISFKESEGGLEPYVARRKKSSRERNT